MSNPAQKPTERSRRSIQTIHLEAYDDVTSIRDRLQFVTMRRALLVFPKDGKILRKKLDLILIQREAARRQIQLALLCTDPMVAEHANSLNISCFFSLRQARSRRWKRGQTKVFVDRASRPATSLQSPFELMPRVSRRKLALSKGQRRRRALGQVLIGLVLLVAMLGGFFAIIPSATVTLTPATDAINEPIIIAADPALTEIDPLAEAMPAQVIQVLIPGSTVTIEASGRRDATDALAIGQVTFTNQSSGPVFIPAGTVVSTDTTPPARFSIDIDAPLPAEAGATTDVPITALADSSGSAGNVPAGAITRVEGQLETTVSASNRAATFGGGVREDAVVTQADHDRLLTLGRQAVQQAARNELLLQLPSEDKFLVPDSIRVFEERREWMTYSAQVNDPAQSVSLDMRAMVEAVVVDQLQARQLAFILLSRRLPEGRELDAASLTYRREGIGLDEQGRYVFQMFVEGNTPFAIDTDAVAERVSGMSIGDARRTLENELLLDPRHPPEIRVSPIDLGIMPILPVRINVEINRS